MVDMTPFTLLVITLPSDNTLLLLIKLKVVVDNTPLILLFKVMVLVVLALVKTLDPITDDVALTPLTVVVNVLPDKVVVSELIILAIAEVTPLTIV